jgi:hypothetical protein
MVENKAETENEISYDDVVDAFRKFVDEGVRNPDDLDIEDLEVKKAYGLFQDWQEQVDRKASNNEELNLRATLVKTMMFVDAGFDDPEYLKEILNEWLMTDAQNAEKQAGNPDRVETRRLISEAIAKIREKIRSK